MARKKREVPEINAGSMADIAFLLLIFFLVTTTMDADKGINRMLPPWDPDQPEDQENIIKERNIYTVLINSNDLLLVENDYMELKDVRKGAVEFLLNNGDGTCGYCQGGLRDPESSDNPNKAVISLQNDRGTSYEMYIKVQNELVAAYEEVRDQLSMQRHGKPFKSLKDEELIKEIKEAFPQKISEAEPLNLGG